MKLKFDSYLNDIIFYKNSKLKLFEKIQFKSQVYKDTLQVYMGLVFYFALFIQRIHLHKFPRKHDFDLNSCVFRIWRNQILSTLNTDKMSFFPYFKYCTHNNDVSADYDRFGWTRLEIGRTLKFLSVGKRSSAKKNCLSSLNSCKVFFSSLHGHITIGD